MACIYISTMRATTIRTVEDPAWEDIWFDRVLALMGAGPLLSYGALMLFAAYAAGVSGHWPVPNMPDPKALPLNGSALVFLSILGAAMSTPIYLIAITLTVLARGCRLSWQRPSRWISKWEAAGLVACVSGLMAWGFVSRGLLRWLCD
jgi:hypothetical protein